MIISVKKNSKHWSNQRKTDWFLAKFAHKIGHLFTNCFSVKLDPKISAKMSWNQLIFHKSVPENPVKSDSFFCNLPEALKKVIV